MGQSYLRRWCAGLIAGTLFVCAQLFAVEPGTERLMVIHELGRPTYSVARGSTEVLTYPGGVRITLVNGKVTQTEGLAARDASTAPTAKPAEAAVPEPGMTKAEADELAQMEKEQADENAKARAKMEKAIEAMERDHDHPQSISILPTFSWKEFLLGLVLKWGLTVAALLLTCKYWGCEVPLTGLMTVAAVDAGLRGVVGGVGLGLLKMPSLFYADEALAAIAMVLVLRKVSYNQSMNQAVQITLTCKTFSIVVGSLLFTVLMRAIG